jgi:hypothetical protein
MSSLNFVSENHIIVIFSEGLQMKNRKNITGFFMDAYGCGDGIPGGGGR